MPFPLLSGATGMVVDDDPQVLRGCVRVLESHGCTVEAVPSHARLRELVSSSRYFEFVMVDLELDEGFAFGEVRQLVDERGPQSVVVMTGWPDADHHWECMAAGAFGILAKPMTSSELLEHASAAILHWRNRSSIEARLRARRDQGNETDLIGIPKASKPESRHQQLHPAATEYGLSPREAQAFSLLIRGLPNADIAEKMGVVVRTVKDFNKKIYEKTGMKRPDLVLKFGR